MLDVQTTQTDVAAARAASAQSVGLERCVGCGHSQRNHTDRRREGCARPLCDCDGFR
jgi:hypothetical protein